MGDFSRRRRLRAAATAVMGVLMLGLMPASRAAEPEYAVGAHRVTFIDETRPIKATMGFAGSPTRRLDVAIWYPANRRGIALSGQWPMSAV